MGAFAVAAVGMATWSVGALLGAAASGNEVGAWLSGGGAAAAVAGLAFIAKRMASGELVAVPLARLLEEASLRESRLVKLLEDAARREDALQTLLLHREIP